MVASIAEDAGEHLVLRFGCDPELMDRVPRPTPALQGLPDWLRAMPAEAFSATVGALDDTVKRCPPFLDAMAQGFLIPLVCDVEVREGQFSWEFDAPPLSSGFARSPLGFHDPAQVSGTPFFERDQFLLKFHNVWTIKAPAGHSVLFIHPLNRADLPFATLTGLVDCDKYCDAPIHFPARWIRPDFEGVLPRGTPIAQCIPIRREAYQMQISGLSRDDLRRTGELMASVRRERGHYRRHLRAGRR